ncbi:hypothetical protein Tco_1551926 [Tanacetum coccineum]
MSTPVNTFSTDSQMHNNIMAAENGEYLGKCIFEGPYNLTSVVIEAVDATINSLEVPEHDEAETVHNMSEENKLYFKAEQGVQLQAEQADWLEDTDEEIDEQEF